TIANRWIDFHAEESLSGDRDIEWTIGVFHRTLFEIELRIADLCTQANKDAGRRDFTGSVLRTGLFQREIHQIFEVGARTFERGRFSVREIVGDHVDSS